MNDKYHMGMVHRLGDCNDAGGCLTNIPQSTVFANNLLVSVDGSTGTDHPPCGDDDEEHCSGNWFTAGGGGVNGGPGSGRTSAKCLC